MQIGCRLLSENTKLKMSKTRKGVKREEFSKVWRENISKGKKRPRVKEILCLNCGEIYPEKMVKDGRNNTGFAQRCKKCDYSLNKDRYKTKHLLKAYGITQQDVLIIHSNQKGICPV